jgi:hypothetical protein
MRQLGYGGALAAAVGVTFDDELGQVKVSRSMADWASSGSATRAAIHELQVTDPGEVPAAGRNSWEGLMSRHEEAVRPLRVSPSHGSLSDRRAVQP